LGEFNRRNVGPWTKNSFSEKKSYGEFRVVAGRSHRHGYRAKRPPALAFLTDLDFQRLLGRDAVEGANRQRVIHPANSNTRSFEDVLRFLGS
jgi:hypothetical protein